MKRDILTFPGNLVLSLLKQKETRIPHSQTTLGSFFLFEKYHDSRYLLDVKFPLYVTCGGYGWGLCEQRKSGLHTFLQVAHHYERRPTSLLALLRQTGSFDHGMSLF